MLPEINGRIAKKDQVTIASDALLRGRIPDADTVRLYAHYIELGLPPIACIAHDSFIAEKIDSFPVSFAVTDAIPALEKALTEGSYDSVMDILFASVQEQSWRYSERRELVSNYKKAPVINNRAKPSGEAYRALGINTIVGSPECMLSLSQVPADMLFIKTFDPNTLIQTWHDAEKFESVQLKLTSEPFVTSLYVDEYSVSFYGVGVRIQPRTLYAAFTTDVRSGGTTNMHTPDIRNHKHDPQLMDWESARHCAKIAYAHRFNIDHVWYPEVWSDPGNVISVVVRPYDSYVTHSALMGNGFRDGNRAVAATMFARALKVPIEVLE